MTTPNATGTNDKSPRHNLKSQPNRQRYLQILRSMTPEQRLEKAFELSAMAKELFMTGLRERFPAASPEEIRRIMLQRLQRCHNRNY